MKKHNCKCSLIAGNVVPNPECPVHVEVVRVAPSRSAAQPIDPHLVEAAFAHQNLILQINKENREKASAAPPSEREARGTCEGSNSKTLFHNGRLPHVKSKMCVNWSSSELDWRNKFPCRVIHQDTPTGTTCLDCRQIAIDNPSKYVAEFRTQYIEWDRTLFCDNCWSCHLVEARAAVPQTARQLLITAQEEIEHLEAKVRALEAAAVPQAAADEDVLKALREAQETIRWTIGRMKFHELAYGELTLEYQNIGAAIRKVEARAAAVPAPAQMDFWFKLADKVAQKYGVPFLQIDELGLFMQNEARHLLAGATAPPKEG